MHSGDCSGFGVENVCGYTQKERTFLARETALEDVGVVISVARFEGQDGNIN